MRHRPEAAILPLPLVRVPRPAAFALVALLAPFVTQAQVVRERVSVEAVTVTVTARDGAGRPVRDLRAADLSLTVDGKKQTLTAADASVWIKQGEQFFKRPIVIRNPCFHRGCHAQPMIPHFTGQLLWGEISKQPTTQCRVVS